MIATKSEMILHAVFADDGDVTMACADVLDQIERVTVEAGEASWADRYPALHRHVTTCGHCAGIYRDLRWIMNQVDADTLIEPAAYPPANLSFLPGPLTHLRQRVGQVISQGQYWMRNTHGTTWLSLAQYLQVRPSGMATKNPLPGEHLVHLACQPDDNLMIELVADAANDDRVIVTAYVRQPARFHQGYGGSEVSLHFGTERRTGVTDDAGRVIFAQIPANVLPDLVVQVIPFDCDP